MMARLLKIPTRQNWKIWTRDLDEVDLDDEPLGRR